MTYFVIIDSLLLGLKKRKNFNDNTNITFGFFE
jgi:hypothetical protein